MNAPSVGATPLVPHQERRFAAGLRRALAVTVVAGLLAAACSASQQLDPVDEASRLTGDLSYVLESAIESGASDFQIEILTEALKVGELTYEQVALAHEPFYACMEDAGIPVTVRGAVEEAHTGLLVPDYIQPSSERMTFEEVSTLSNECYIEHVNFLMGYYVSQPQAVDHYLQTFEEQRAFIVDCLTKRGFPVDADSTRLELLYAVTEEHMSGNSGRPCYQGNTFVGFLPD